MDDFGREVEQSWGAKLPVRRGDTGVYREDGAASTAAALAGYRAAQLSARAAELLALWDDRVESRDAEGGARRRRRLLERQACWRGPLAVAEHTSGAAASVGDPDGGRAVAPGEAEPALVD